MSKKAFIFPGQGAQYPGMGADFYESYSIFRELFEEADHILSRSLSKLILKGSLDELTLTKNSQPAIYLTSMGILRVLQKEFPDLMPPDVCGGLSLGEYTALAAAEKLSFESALKLVAERGKAMQEACETEKGSMAAVMGLSEDEIRDAGYWIANMNCPGQIVIAGRISDMEKASIELKDKGARKIIPLKVAGAFHTPLMQSATEKMKAFINSSEIKSSDIAIVMNVSGNFVSNEELMREYLIEQIANPTKWMDCVKAMEEFGVNTFYEIGPTQLVAMNRKIGVKGSTIKIEKIEDLESVYESTRR